MGSRDTLHDKWCLELWQNFIFFLSELKYGLPVDEKEYWSDHADRLKMKAERFAAAFQRIAGASGFTPYIHVILNHVSEVVRRFGGIIKGCSHGAECLHQRIQNTTATSNRHEDTLGSQVLTREVMSTMASAQKEMKLNYRNKTFEHVHGGFMSKKERDEYAVMMQKACEACSLRLHA
jgi:hypothetical protein